MKYIYLGILLLSLPLSAKAQDTTRAPFQKRLGITISGGGAEVIHDFLPVASGAVVWQTSPKVGMRAEFEYGSITRTRILGSNENPYYDTRQIQSYRMSILGEVRLVPMLSRRITGYCVIGVSWLKYASIFTNSTSNDKAVPLPSQDLHYKEFGIVEGTGLRLNITSNITALIGVQAFLSIRDFDVRNDLANITGGVEYLF